MSLHLVPILPAWLIAALVLALLAVLAHGSVMLLRKQIPPRWVGILAGLRVALVLLFALVLLQPVFSYTRSAEHGPDLLVLLDTSASMGQPGSEASVSRLDEVTRSLDQSGLTRELEKRFAVRWFAIDRGAALLDDSERQRLKATGPGTAYADGLTQAWSYPRGTPAADGSAGPPPERVLLVSDGLDRGTLDIVDVAQRFGVPIDVIAPGSPPPSRDEARISIGDVQGARRVMLGSETHFLVMVRSDRATTSDRMVTVHLAEGGKDQQTANVVLRAGRTEETLRLATRPTELGPKRYEFRTTADGVDSPVYPLSVQIIDGRQEVLVLEDTWRWEFKFLRRVLEEDPSFRFTGLLSRGGGSFMQFAAPDRRATLVGFPQSRGQLAMFDTVILGDVDPRRWPRELASSLGRFVAEDGKSLVVMAGPNLARWGDAPDLLALLPVEITRETSNPVTGPVPLRISDDGVRSPFFLEPGGGALPANLPALDQIYAPLRKKPAASVLLEAAKSGNAYGPLIVMAEQTVGRGRVLYIGTDTLWKWQMLTTATDANSTPLHRFWQQTLRAMSPVRSGGRSVNLWLQPRRSRYEAGQRAVVRAEVDARTALPQANVQGVVTLPDGKALSLTFAPDAASPKDFIAEFETGPAGQYRLTATVVSEGKTAAESATAIDVDEPRPEADGSPVDAANLARIAASTGGKVIDPANRDTWPTSVATRERVVERQTVDFWNRSYLLILLAAVAGADWLLRLLRGYV